MKLPQRLLLLEDDPNDAELLRRALVREWPECEVVRVADEAAFRKALEEAGFDLVLSDYIVPGFDGPSALRLVRQRWPDLPFLFVSGVIGDEVAVESLKAGATDYVLKDRPARLVPAIRRALEEAEERGSRRRVEDQLRHSEALKGAIMEGALDGIIVVDHEGNIIEFNRASEKALGYSRATMFGQSFVEKIVPQALRGRIREGMQQYLSHGGGPFIGRWQEFAALRADGSEFPAELAIIPLCVDEHIVFTAFLHDVTPRKRAYEKIRRVQDKLRQTNRNLTRKNHEVESFYHTLSHELKTPLTSAREFVSIVMDGLAGPLSETQSRYLGFALESCNQLRVCINDLFDATRLETGKLLLESKPASLAGLVQRTVAAGSRIAAEKGIALSPEVQPDLPEAVMDENRIAQVIANLVNNAIKYTPAGGQIVVRAGEARERPDFLQVAVSDTGRGIPLEEQERIFDRLYQIKNGDATTEQGVGLGLYLCRELVKLHGGSIRVESEPGAGSTFTFVIPRNPQSLQPNLLIIDDDPELLEVLRLLLTAEHYNVRLARDGREGLQEIRRQTPDVVMIDLAMPNVNGPATLSEIRRDWGAIPVIVHTAFTDGNLMKQALEHSALTVLAKPCSTQRLLETLRMVQRLDDTSHWKKNHFDAPKNIN